MPSSSLYHAARMLGDGLLRLVYPPACLGCGRAVPDAQHRLCAACLSALGRPDAADVAARLARLPAAQDAFDGTFALWALSDDSPLQRVHYALKYGNRPRYGPALGRRMARGWREQEKPGGPATADPEDAAVVVPIPLHRRRLLERGYNQSTLLARGLADTLGLPMDERLLRRLRATSSQTALSGPARWRNVDGAFIAPRPVRRPVVLVDDVLTTGATAAAAARALQAAGAPSVRLAVLALASL